MEKDILKDFYKTFKIGIEIEGEFHTRLDNDPQRLLQTNEQAWRNWNAPRSECQDCPRCNDFGSCEASSEKYQECQRRSFERANPNYKDPEVKLVETWQVGTDGSISSRHKGFCYELRSKIIASNLEEYKHLKELAKHDNKKGYFAKANPTLSKFIPNHYKRKKPIKLLQEKISPCG